MCSLKQPFVEIFCFHFKLQCCLFSKKFSDFCMSSQLIRASGVLLYCYKLFKYMENVLERDRAWRF